jgi:hypothetical protein
VGKNIFMILSLYLQYFARCLLACLASNTPVPKLPNLPYPMYTDRGKANSSTPNEQDQTMAGLAEASMCSTILHPARLVEDTMNCTNMCLEVGLVATIKGKTTADSLAGRELGKVKKAGSFLDCCKVYLSGFTTLSRCCWPGSSSTLARRG